MTKPSAAFGRRHSFGRSSVNILIANGLSSILVGLINLLANVMVGRLLGPAEFSSYMGALNAVLICAMLFRGLQASFFKETLNAYEARTSSGGSVEFTPILCVFKRHSLTLALFSVPALPAIAVVFGIANINFRLLFPSFGLFGGILLLMIMVGALQAHPSYFVATLSLTIATAIQLPILGLIFVTSSSPTSGYLLLAMSIPAVVTYFIMIPNLRRLPVIVLKRSFRSVFIGASPAMVVGICSSLPGLFFSRTFDTQNQQMGAVLVLTLSALSGIAQMTGALIRTLVGKQQVHVSHRQLRNFLVGGVFAIGLAQVTLVYSVGGFVARLMFPNEFADVSGSVTVAFLTASPWIIANAAIWFQAGEISSTAKAVLPCLLVLLVLLFMTLKSFLTVYIAFGLIGCIAVAVLTMGVPSRR